MSLESYQELLAGVSAPSRLREGDGVLPPELELQAAWFAGVFGRDFIGVDGQRVRVVQFGHWNRSAGPDFVDAVVEIDGEARRGAIELDPTARDWEHHGHSENLAYDAVVLHLFFEAAPAAGGRFFTRTASHNEVAQVLMDLEPFAESSRRAEAEARVGRCRVPLGGMSDEAVASLFDAAARHRMSRKSKAFGNYASIHGRDEALFAGLAEALGFRRNRLPMRVLAGRLPLAYLRELGESAEALLFGAAGFLDEPSYEDAPADTREYLRGLWGEWWKRRAEFDPARAPQWSFSGSRPSNHPHRRLAALAQIVSHWDEWSKLAWRKPFDPKLLRRFVEKVDHPYWLEHYTLKSVRAKGPTALIGATRVSDILANVLLPARLPEEPELWEMYRSLPAGLGNQKLRRASARLFGDGEQARGGRLQKSLYAQQAMLQIYDDFCMADESDCEDCPFPEQLAQWR
jgi:hypothetical protein